MGATEPLTPPYIQPPLHSGADHSFTLQAIMEMHKQIGSLTEAVNALKHAGEKSACRIEAAEDKITQKVESLADKVSGLSHKIYAAGVVIAIFVAIGAFLVSKAWDLIAATAAPTLGQ